LELKLLWSLCWQMNWRVKEQRNEVPDWEVETWKRWRQGGHWV
jgi:hypothetical protein